MDDLLQEFIAETRETLEGISGEIVAWESNPGDQARLDSIFRFVHTVKGSCGFLDLPRLARLSNAAEDVLSAVRSGARVADKPLVDGVLAIIDRIGELVEAIDAGASLDQSGEELLIAALDPDAIAPVEKVLPAAAMTPQRNVSRSVRLSVDLLDRMMSGMSEMVLARNDLARRMRVDGGDPATEAALDRLSATVADMRDTVTRTRMQRIEALFTPFPRLVRDTAAMTGKQVALTLDGADVELDREMIEMMRDPLAHMVRNAIDHGIESPDDRVAAGKRATGRLTISARQSGNRIIIEIADDGRGVDTERLIDKIGARDPARRATLRALTDRGRLDLIFEPGLSSRDAVTALSGRGVGMDVVRANVEQIGGRIDLANRPGQGLTVSIEVPLTLAILPTVIVTVADQRFAVARQAIEEIVTTRADGIRLDPFGDIALATVRGRRLAYLDLRAVLGLEDRHVPPPFVAIVDVPGGAFALGIDGVVDTEELVIKPVAPAIMAARVYAGQALPDTGLPMLLLDCAGIADDAGLKFEADDDREDTAVAAPVATIPVLLIDDLDGVRRAIVLDAVDRIEKVAVDAIAISGGRLRMIQGDRTVPLVALAALPVTGDVTVVRVTDGAIDVGYVVAGAHDIVGLTAPIAPAQTTGMIAGVAVIASEVVEIVDSLWLMAEGAAVPSAGRPVCLLRGAASGWMKTFLAPTLEAAGYRVVESLDADTIAAVTLAMAGEAIDDTATAPVIRLSRDSAGGINCYDRAALVAAVAKRIGGAG